MAAAGGLHGILGRRVSIAATLLILLPVFALEDPRAAAPPGPYAVTDLGTLGGLSAQAFDINDAGHIVGYATTAASQGHAFVWRDGVMTDLGTLGGSQSLGHAINASGDIVGRATVIGNPAFHAVLWQNGTLTDLTPGDQGYSVANAINSAGQIVGTRNNSSGFLWQGGAAIDLGHLGGGGSFAADINDAGHVVGSSYTTHVTELGPMPHAFVWRDGVMSDLGVLPGEEDSGAAAISRVGQVVGSSGRTDPQTYEVTSRSFLYENGTMTALPVPSQESYAGDINDEGLIVGMMRAAGGFSKYHAYIYADGVVTNLNTLILPGSGLHLSAATAINSAGQIVGWGYDSRGSSHAFLLTPVAAGSSVVNITDATVTEGHTGARSASFTITLSVAAIQPVTVSYATANGSATAGGDYEAAAGTITFDAGQTSRTVTVQVNGDRVGEADETFLVNLSQGVGAVIGDAQGRGTIVDDEPRVSISDVSRNEGQSGTTPFAFTITLSTASDVATTVSFATANASARAAEDFDARSGSLVFGAGETSKTVSVSVRGDRAREGNEVFHLNLSGATGAFLADSQGAGVVRNDDR